MEPRINYPKVVPGALEAMLGFYTRGWREKGIPFASDHCVEDI